MLKQSNNGGAGNPETREDCWFGSKYLPHGTITAEAVLDTSHGPQALIGMPPQIVEFPVLRALARLSIASHSISVSMRENSPCGQFGTRKQRTKTVSID